MEEVNAQDDVEGGIWRVQGLCCHLLGERESEERSVCAMQCCLA